MPFVDERRAGYAAEGCGRITHGRRPAWHCRESRAHGIRHALAAGARRAIAPALRRHGRGTQGHPERPAGCRIGLGRGRGTDHCGANMITPPRTGELFLDALAVETAYREFAGVGLRGVEPLTSRLSVDPGGFRIAATCRLSLWPQRDLPSDRTPETGLCRVQPTAEPTARPRWPGGQK